MEEAMWRLEGEGKEKAGFQGPNWNIPMCDYDRIAAVSMRRIEV